MAQNKSFSVPIIGPAGSGKSNIYNFLVSSESYAFSAQPIKKATLQTKGKTYHGTKVTYYDFPKDIDVQPIQGVTNNTKTKLICLVFDATDPNFTHSIETYLTEKGIEISASTSLLLLGNKMDLLTSDQRQSVTKLAQGYIARHYKERGQFFPGSAAEPDTLESLADKIVSIVSYAPEDDLVSAATSTTRKLKRRRSFVSSMEGSLADDDSSIAGESDEDYLQYERRSVASHNSNKSATHRGGVRGAAFGASAGQFAPLSPVKEVREGVTPSRTGGSAASARKSTTPYRNSSGSMNPPPPNGDTYLSAALRLAGLALIVAAITSLIYLLVVAAGLASSALITGVVNQSVVTIGGFLGMGSPATAFANLCAALGMSTATASGILVAGASLMTLGLGCGLRYLGRKPEAAGGDPSPAPAEGYSFAWRLLGMTLMVAALTNMIYLLLIGVNVFSSSALLAGMNQILTTVGGLFGWTAPVAAFEAGASVVGLSATTATGVLSATVSVLAGGLGYMLFRRGAPQGADGGAANADRHAHESGRVSPSLQRVF